MSSCSSPVQYVYSAWAPQFAERLKLSSTESNLIGLFGNLGMYTMGVPIGMFVDGRGPRPAVLAGALLLAIGYFPLHQAYQQAGGHIGLMCFFSYLTGLGGCMAFAAAVKTSALNWPHNRGTATAFPLAAFGLSAFFFSALGSIVASDPSDFLMLLAAGSCGLCFVGFFFLKVYPHQTYHPVARGSGSVTRRDSQRLRRTSTNESKPRRPGHLQAEPGTSSSTTVTAPSDDSNDSAAAALEYAAVAETLAPPASADGSRSSSEEDIAVDETSSLVSSSTEGREILAGSVDMDRSHRVDIRGFDLLRDFEFWQLFTIMAILSGIGLMTIK